MQTPVTSAKANSEFRKLGRNRYSIEIQVNEDTARALKLMTHRGGGKAKAMLTHCAHVLGEISQRGITYQGCMEQVLGNIKNMKREYRALSPAAVEAGDLVTYISACRKRRIAPDLSAVRLSPMWDVLAKMLSEADFAQKEILQYAKECSGGRAWLRSH